MPCRSWSRCSSSGRTGGDRSYKRPSDRSFIFFLERGRKSAKGYGTNETRLSTNCWTASFPLRKYVGDCTVHFVRTAQSRSRTAPDEGNTRQRAPCVRKPTNRRRNRRNGRSRSAGRRHSGGLSVRSGKGPFSVVSADERSPSSARDASTASAQQVVKTFVEGYQVEIGLTAIGFQHDPPCSAIVEAGDVLRAEK